MKPANQLRAGRPGGWLGLVFGGILGVLLLSAAIGKAWDFDRFGMVVDYVFDPLGLSRLWVVFLASLVIFVEVVLGLHFLCGRWRRWTVGLTAAMFLAFSVVLYSFAIDPASPDCGCTGLLRVLEREASGAYSGLVRNGAILVMLMWMFVNAPKSSNKLSERAALSQATAGNVARGFTLVELLVSIVIIAVLISLSLPSLSRAKKSATLTRSLSTHRQLGMALMAYTEDNREVFPYFATPGDPYGPKVIAGFDISGAYFRVLGWHWTSLLVPNYIDAAAIQFARWPELRKEWGWPTEIVRSPFHLTHNAFAAPRYWYEDAPPEDLKLLRSTSRSDVLFPSQKGLVVDVSVGVLFDAGEQGVMSTGMADGSAKTIPWSGIDWEQVVSRPFGAMPFPVYSTRRGLHANAP